MARTIAGTLVETGIVPNQARRLARYLSGVGGSAGGFPKLSQSILNVRNRTGRAKIAFIGDSTWLGVGDIATAGPGAGDPTVPPNVVKSRSIASQLAANMIAAGFPTRFDAVAGAVGLTGAFNTVQNGYNSDITVPADWTAANLGVGAPFFTSPTGTTSSYVFTPPVAADTFEILYGLFPGNGTFTVTDASGTLATQATANAAQLYGRITVTRATASRLPISIQQSVNGTNGIQIGMIFPYNSAAPAVEFVNLGAAGSTTGTWVAGSSTWRPLNAAAFLAFDAVVINLGLNDKNTGVAASTYQTNLQSIVSAFKAAGSDIILVHPHSGLGGTPYDFDASYDAAWYVVAATAIAQGDLRSVSLVTADYFDTVHLVGAGYGKEAAYLSQLLVPSL